jgi:DNA-binding CsgD family transcriptional regulator
MPWPLVGRTHELEQIAALLASGPLHGALLAGPAGVGKTRLATEAVRLAEEAGMATAVCRATRAASTIALGAFAPFLPVADTFAERGVDALARARAAVLAVAHGRRLTLVVDDAHLLDDASAALVHQLVAAENVFVVATMRADEPAPDPIVALWKDGLAARLPVVPLTRTEVEQLVGEVLGGMVDGALAHVLYEASGGNALYLRELVNGAVAGGDLVAHDGVWRLHGALRAPAHLLELVADRLAALSEPAVAALELVALGEPLELSVLEAQHPLEVLEELEARGVATTTTSGRRRSVRLAHPMYGEALRRRLPTARATRIRRVLAGRVTAHGARRREDALRIATWWLEGGQTAIGAEVLLLAARRALAGFDLGHAERLAEAARDAGAGVAAQRTLGDVLHFQGRYQEAEQTLAALEDEPMSDRERALAGMARSFNRYWGFGDRAGAEAVADAVLAGLADRSWRQELAAERATYALFSGDTAAALAQVEPLLADGCLAPRAHVRAVFAAAPALALVGRMDDAIAAVETAQAAVALTPSGLGQAVFTLLVGRAAAFALTEAGRLQEAERVARTGYELALVQHSTTSQAVAAWTLGRVALAAGHLTAARHWLREATAVEAQVGLVGRQRWSPTGLALAHALSGDAVEARAALGALAAAPASSDGFLRYEGDRAEAWTLVAEGARREAVELLDVAAARALGAGEATAAMTLLHDLARLGEAVAVADRMAAVAPRVDGHLAAARARHVAALARGDAVALEQVSGDFAGLGFVLDAAEAAFSAADAHRREGRPRDAARCARQAAVLAAATEGARTPGLVATAEVGTLTRRQREIAELAATGLSSPDIAARLQLSVRTVNNHLQQVYGKLGVTTRTGLRAALGREPAA